MKGVKRVAVTGGAGQIAYSLLFRIAAGEMLGPDQPIALHLLELPQALAALEGVVMELRDCAFPLLREIRVGSSPVDLFRDVDYALLVGSKPRGPGMERKELLQENGKIFIEQGRALNESAARDCKVLVVGNPCNTNCLIAMHSAPDLPRENFSSMMRLDQNRAAAQLAMKAGCRVNQVKRIAVWGNHSATQVPDFIHAQIDGRAVTDLISDRKWLEKQFVEQVQKRGAAVIAARGKSSAASAAHAAIESVRSLIEPTEEGDWFSAAVYTDGSLYGVPEGLFFSFPCRSNGKGGYSVVEGLEWDDFLAPRIDLSLKELLEERDAIRDLIGEVKNG